MKTLIIYSSVTGNTKMLAEAIFKIMPPQTTLSPVYKAPPPDDFDLIILGFWVSKAKPDSRSLRYIKTIFRKKIAFFGTLAAYPDSEHAKKVINNTKNLLTQNEILGNFLCQGKLAPKRFAQYMNSDHKSSSHPMTEARKTRLIEANCHPNENDFQAAQSYFKKILKLL